MDWYAVLDIYGSEYGYTKSYCLYQLSLPDIMNYLDARGLRYQAQNEAMEADRDGSSQGATEYVPRGKEKKVTTVEDFALMMGGKVNKLMNNER